MKLFFLFSLVLLSSLHGPLSIQIAFSQNQQEATNKIEDEDYQEYIKKYGGDKLKDRKAETNVEVRPEKAVNIEGQMKNAEDEDSDMEDLMKNNAKLGKLQEKIQAKQMGDIGDNPQMDMSLGNLSALIPTKIDAQTEQVIKDKIASSPLGKYIPANGKVMAFIMAILKDEKLINDLIKALADKNAFSNYRITVFSLIGICFVLSFISFGKSTILQNIVKKLFLSLFLMVGQILNFTFFFPNVSKGIFNIAKKVFL